MGTLTALLREAETGHRRSGSKVAPVLGAEEHRGRICRSRSRAIAVNRVLMSAKIVACQQAACMSINPRSGACCEIIMKFACGIDSTHVVILVKICAVLWYFVSVLQPNRLNICISLSLIFLLSLSLRPPPPPTAPSLKNKIHPVSKSVSLCPYSL